MNIGIPRIFRVPIKVIVIHFRLKVWMPVKIAGRFVTGRSVAVMIFGEKICGQDPIGTIETFA